MTAAFVPADLALSRKLERAEGAASARHIEARARRFPESGAAWIEVAGAYAMYDGPASPLTQTFGLGMFAPAGAADLDELEAFFRERGAPVHHEVSPHAGIALAQLLQSRRYQPVEFTNVMFLPLAAPRAAAPSANDRIRVRIASGNERDLWARTAVEGWSSEPVDAASPDFLDLMRVAAGASGAFPFLAERDGRPIAAGMLSIQGEVALLAGASTVPAHRNLGAQQAILETRLQHASEAGCELAMMCAEPGSASQRNAERVGFRIAYTRTKWRLAG